MQVVANMTIKYPEGSKPIGAKGSSSARIVVVGEAPGADEDRAGKPFMGVSGKELDRMLTDAGILEWSQAHGPNGPYPVPDYDKTSIYFTNVTLIRPPDNDINAWVQRPGKSGHAKRKKGKNPTPDHWVEYRGWLVEPHVAEDARRLIEEIKAIKPNVVIALGNTPFWALCKEGIIGKVGVWRGSSLISDSIDGLKVIPAYHPAFILRQWQHRRITVQDFRRAKAASAFPALPPVEWQFTLMPSYDQAASFLQGLLFRLEEGEVYLTCDIEGAQKKTLCVGIAVSDRQAICIPILYKYGFYFPADQRWVIHMLMQRVLCHKNARVINQNIGFDTQFLVNDLLIYPNIYWDTMIAQNVLFPGTSEARTMNLAYMASMYCRQYRYWKDDSAEFWKAKRIDNWEQIWFYNCEDCCRTFEVFERQREALVKRNLVKQFDFLQRRIFPLIRKAMFRGVRVQLEDKQRMLRELVHVSAYAQNRVNYLATRQLDISSPKQLQDFFYRELKLPVQFGIAAKGETATPTCDADALVVLAEHEPLIRELVRWINLYRSYIAAIKVCKAETDEDGRWRSSYSLGLVETYRLSSSENPYGRGLNLMNISAGKDVKDAEDD
jgi:uracil-DNA glycosylase